MLILLVGKPINTSPLKSLLFFKPPFRRQAFTLIEIAVSLIILSLLISVSVPYSLRSLNTHRFNRLRSRLSVFLSEVHQTSFLSLSPFDIQINNTEHTLSFSSPKGLKKISYPSFFSISLSEAPDSLIEHFTLFPSGFCSHPFLYISYEDENISIRLPLL